MDLSDRSFVAAVDEGKWKAADDLAGVDRKIPTVKFCERN